MKVLQELLTLLEDNSDRIRRTDSQNEPYTKTITNLNAIRKAVNFGLEVQIKDKHNGPFRTVELSSPSERIHFLQTIDIEINDPELLSAQYFIPYQQVDVDTANKILKETRNISKDRLLDPDLPNVVLQALHSWEDGKTGEMKSSYELHTSHATKVEDKNTTHWTVEAKSLAPDVGNW